MSGLTQQTASATSYVLGLRKNCVSAACLSFEAQPTPTRRNAAKSDQRDSVKEGWHESAPNLADIGAKLVVGTSDHRDAVKVTWQKQRAEPSW